MAVRSSPMQFGVPSARLHRLAVCSCLPLPERVVYKTVFSVLLKTLLTNYQRKNVFSSRGEDKCTRLNTHAFVYGSTTCSSTLQQLSLHSIYTAQHLHWRLTLAIYTVLHSHCTHISTAQHLHWQFTLHSIYNALTFTLHST